MKKFLLSLICLMCFVGIPSKSYCETSDDALIELFYLAAETGDAKLIQDVIQAILDKEDSSAYLLDALAKYSEKGKVDFALHNAIKDKNILASIILAHYSKDVNTSKGFERCHGASKHSEYRDAKTPLELSLEADMKGLIPYLLMRGANPYHMRKVSFILDGEENISYLAKFYSLPPKKTDAKKAYYETFPCQRTLIGDAIVANRLDVFKLLDKSKIDWNKTCFSYHNASDLTPLQFSLAIQRYEIAQFLIDHGAKIE